MSKLVNDVYLSGVVHFLKGESYGESRLGKYFEFSLKRQYSDTDGCDRVDYLRMRVFDPAIQECRKRARPCGLPASFVRPWAAAGST